MPGLNKLIELGVGALVLIMLIVALWFMPLLTITAAASVVAADLIVLFVRARKAKRWKPTTTWEAGEIALLQPDKPPFLKDVAEKLDINFHHEWPGEELFQREAYLAHAADGEAKIIETTAPFCVEYGDILKADATGEGMLVLSRNGTKISIQRSLKRGVNPATLQEGSKLVLIGKIDDLMRKICDGK